MINVLEPVIVQFIHAVIGAADGDGDGFWVRIGVRQVWVHMLQWWLRDSMDRVRQHMLELRFIFVQAEKESNLKIV